MFDERVTGLKLELAGDFADTNCYVARQSSARHEDRIHHRWYLQPWFHRALRQYEIRFERVCDIILHDFERAFRLRAGKGHAELVKAVFRKLLPENLQLRIVD